MHVIAGVLCEDSVAVASFAIVAMAKIRVTFHSKAVLIANPAPYEAMASLCLVQEKKVCAGECLGRLCHRRAWREYVFAVVVAIPDLIKRSKLGIGAEAYFATPTDFSRRQVSDISDDVRPTRSSIGASCFTLNWSMPSGSTVR